MQRYLKRAKELESEIVENRRKIHQFGGIGFDIQETSDFVFEKLQSYGLHPQRMCGTGIVCTIGSGGKTILLRADMDALPIQEDTGLPFACQNGTAHACGHDMHTAMLLAAAKMLSETQDELKGTVTEEAYGQPAGRITVDQGLAFTDVAATSPYYDGIEWAVDEGITNGTTATTFSPYQNCTRAQIITYLWRAAGSPEPASTEPAYTDVTDTSLYFFKAVQWASEQGLVEGETFDPYAGCTRAMAVYFMWVAADSPEAAAASFTDVAADADYAAAVNWAVAQGVTLGTGDGSTFSPDTVCQRGQIVTFLYRAANAAA